jgi:hypothetical protein
MARVSWCRTVYGNVSSPCEKVGVPKHSELEPDYSMAARSGNPPKSSRIASNPRFFSPTPPRHDYPLFDWNPHKGSTASNSSTFFFGLVLREIDIPSPPTELGAVSVFHFSPIAEEVTVFVCPFGLLVFEF